METDYPNNILAACQAAADVFTNLLINGSCRLCLR